MATRTMIHKGVSIVTVPARTELREVPDPDGPEGAVILVEQEVEPAREEKVKLPAGTRFGEHLILTAYEISDPEKQKALAGRGFEFVNKETAKKLDAKAERAEAGSPEAVNRRTAERDRSRAIVSQAQFEPGRGATGETLIAARKVADTDTKGGEK